MAATTPVEPLAPTPRGKRTVGLEPRAHEPEAASRYDAKTLVEPEGSDRYTTWMGRLGRRRSGLSARMAGSSHRWTRPAKMADRVWGASRTAPTSGRL